MSAKNGTYNAIITASGRLVRIYRTDITVNSNRKEFCYSSLIR
jgi:hypothetical protein